MIITTALLLQGEGYNANAYTHECTYTCKHMHTRTHVTHTNTQTHKQTPNVEHGTMVWGTGGWKKNKIKYLYTA